MTILAFDVDGTITDPRRPIEGIMLDLMLNLCSIYKVWLVTGSDEPKCREQIGSELFNAVGRVYCCAGAERWSGTSLVSSNGWNPPVQLIVDLFSAIDEIGYEHKTGKHVEIRTGMVNLSIPGRNASQDQRDQFTAWDQKTGTRRRIANELNRKYPQVHATLGGKTGVDITERGRGKHVIIADAQEPIWFWGDECRTGGNDCSLAESLTRPGDRVFHTTGWQDTYHQLKEIMSV